MENYRDIYAYAYDAFNIFLENLTMFHVGKRDVFKRVGNVKLLRKLNPYYQEEEIVYKKIKETSEI